MESPPLPSIDDLLACSGYHFVAFTTKYHERFESLRFESVTKDNYNLSGANKVKQPHWLCVIITPSSRGGNSYIVKFLVVDQQAVKSLRTGLVKKTGWLPTVFLVVRSTVVIRRSERRKYSTKY